LNRAVRGRFEGSAVRMVQRPHYQRQAANVSRAATSKLPALCGYERL